MSLEEAEFHIELNETLHFENGYEVRELISIAMEPEVSIHSYDTYISIRGEIELHGEYLRDQINTPAESGPDLDSFQTKRFVEKIEIKEGEIAEFTHRFPVDISVPPYRVHSADDVVVEMMEFDYELPENTTLKIKALAAIHGIKAEINLFEEKESKEKENDMEENERQSFEFEVTANEMNVEEKMDSPEEKELVELPRTILATEKSTEDEVHNERQENVHAEESTDANADESIKEETDIEREAEKDEYKMKEDAVEDVSYLTDMFGDEEETYSRMKICIVQEDDTIETIAERFQVSILQLIKKNNLEADYEISEGQLLYIPK